MFRGPKSSQGPHPSDRPGPTMSPHPGLVPSRPTTWEHPTRPVVSRRTPVRPVTDPNIEVPVHAFVSRLGLPLAPLASAGRDHLSGVYVLSVGCNSQRT